MISRVERALVVVTPLVAMTAVGVGLELGSRTRERGAVVYGAPDAKAGTGLAWQVVALEEEYGVREPLAGLEVEVVGRTGERTATWRGATNADGLAEARLALPSEGLELEVRSGGALLARGLASAPPGPSPAPPAPAWQRFARREGPVVLEVAVLGQRVLPGFASEIWVHATDTSTKEPLAGVEVEVEDDPSLTLSAARARTDSRGWAVLVATPVGLAIGLVLHARAADGRTGDWSGGLFVSPGAPRVATQRRWSPAEDVEIAVTAPTRRKLAYLEIDDVHGRAWGASLALPEDAANPGATTRAPRLAPGLYWAITAGDPAAAAALGAGTAALPFFVAESDEAALAFGQDSGECTTRRDIREASRALAVCLALTEMTPVERWIALDGFSTQRARDDERRTRGLAVAVGAVLLAMLLEGLLLMRVAATSRAPAASEPGSEGASTVGRGWTVAVVVLVALLGFALFAAFLVRMG